MPRAERLELDRLGAARRLAQAGSSPAGSSEAAPASAGGAAGSEGIDEGSGAAAGSGASLADDPDPPNRRFNQLVMRAMLQGGPEGR
jgi:hypothetical protein